MISTKLSAFSFCAASFLTAATTAVAAPNQGDASKVLTVDNPAVSCAAPEPLEKVEGNMPATIQVQSDRPIDYVTVKSGARASVVSARFFGNSAEITLSQDVSNYVVWVCPPGGSDPPVFPPPPGDVGIT